MQVLPFDVVACSSYEDQYPPHQLLVTHQNSVNAGWATQRFSHFPQVLVIKLSANCRIRKLQLLVHHYKIPTKMEIHVAKTSSLGQKPSANLLLNGDTDEDDGFEDSYLSNGHRQRSTRKVEFVRLGYVVLNDNAKMGYRARELKSIYLDVEGDYVKILLHKPYVNQLNLYNQVALIAVNVLGQIRDSAYYAQSIPTAHALFGEEGLDPPQSNAMGALWGLVHKTATDQKVGLSDDLAFRMARDKETMELVEAIQLAKHQAVLDEDFLLAKSLKHARDAATLTGEDIALLEKDLQDAISAEDYEQAQSIRNEVESHLQDLRSKLDVLGLEWTADGDVIRKRAHLVKNIEESLPEPPPPVLIPDEQSPPIRSLTEQRRMSQFMGSEPALSPKSKSIDAGPVHVPSKHKELEKEKEREPETAPEDEETRPEYQKPPTSTEQLARTPPPGSPTSPQAHRMEAKAPAAVKSPKATTMSRASSGSEMPKSKSKQADDGLTDDQSRDWESCIQVFGQPSIAKFLSKESGSREQGLKDMARHIAQIAPIGGKSGSTVSESVVRAGYQVSTKAFTYTSEKCLCLALDFERAVQRLSASANLSASTVSGHLEEITPVILALVAHSNTRVKQAAVDVIVELGSSSPSLVLPILTQPFPTKKPPLPKVAIGRLEVISRLLDEYGLDNRGSLNAESVMALAGPLLQSSAHEVREASVVVTAKIAVKGSRGVIDPYLKPLRPQQVQNVEDAITKANGHDVKPKAKNARQPVVPKSSDEPQPTKAQAAKIQKLQSQLQELRKLTSERTDVGDHASPKSKGMTSDDEEEPHEEATKKRFFGLNFGRKSQASIDPHRAEGEVDDAVATAAAKKGSKPNKAFKTPDAAPMQKNSEVHNNNDWNFDRRCIFCDEQNDSFTVFGQVVFDGDQNRVLILLQIIQEENLDSHYLKDCKMLTICVLCKKTVEISTLSEHMFSECDLKKTVKKCPRCHEAVLEKEYLSHVAKRECRAHSKDREIARCPLCHEDIPASDSGWRDHLLKEGCRGSTRDSDRRKSRSKEPSQQPPSPEREPNKKSAVVKKTATGAAAKRSGSHERTK
ncbi:hypothetical protein SmJEL517_g04489 [Synchytrium microbalum]|uniref:UVR domain-containing protein n=1 Tax=Synchytrium microbalum TaxID=1806994 RepID=A0A507C4V9_9FUNG|nr:uncharacterized protein SmJEL517_g04489 [Synchytrium microbalum]TPX32465.1 hypothetical protein SmJEL517_g04489 [Synchytrium microbalum]